MNIEIFRRKIFVVEQKNVFVILIETKWSEESLNIIT